MFKRRRSNGSGEHRRTGTATSSEDSPMSDHVQSQSLRNVQPIPFQKPQEDNDGGSAAEDCLLRMNKHVKEISILEKAIGLSVTISELMGDKIKCERTHDKQNLVATITQRLEKAVKNAKSHLKTMTLARELFQEQALAGDHALLVKLTEYADVKMETIRKEANASKEETTLAHEEAHALLQAPDEHGEAKSIDGHYAQTPFDQVASTEAFLKTLLLLNETEREQLESTQPLLPEVEAMLGRVFGEDILVLFLPKRGEPVSTASEKWLKELILLLLRQAKYAEWEKAASAKKPFALNGDLGKAMNGKRLHNKPIEKVASMLQKLFQDFGVIRSTANEFLVLRRSAQVVVDHSAYSILSLFQKMVGSIQDLATSLCDTLLSLVQESQTKPETRAQVQSVLRKSVFGEHYAVANLFALLWDFVSHSPTNMVSQDGYIYIPNDLVKLVEVGFGVKIKEARIVHPVAFATRRRTAKEMPDHFKDSVKATKLCFVDVCVQIIAPMIVTSLGLAPLGRKSAPAETKTLPSFAKQADWASKVCSYAPIGEQRGPGSNGHRDWLCFRQQWWARLQILQAFKDAGAFDLLRIPLVSKMFVFAPESLNLTPLPDDNFWRYIGERVDPVGLTDKHLAKIKSMIDRIQRTGALDKDKLRASIKQARKRQEAKPFLHLITEANLNNI